MSSGLPQIAGRLAAQHGLPAQQAEQLWPQCVQRATAALSVIGGPDWHARCIDELRTALAAAGRERMKGLEAELQQLVEHNARIERTAGELAHTLRRVQELIADPTSAERLAIARVNIRAALAKLAQDPGARTCA